MTAFVSRGAAQFDDLRVSIGGAPFIPIEAISWSDDLEVTEVRGVGGRLIDLVPGNYSGRGSITLPVSEEKDFLTKVNGGAQGRVTLGNKPTIWTVSNGIEGNHAVILKGVVLTGHRVSHTQRSGVLVVSYDFHLERVETDGILPAG